MRRTWSVDFLHINGDMGIFTFDDKDVYWNQDCIAEQLFALFEGWA